MIDASRKDKLLSVAWSLFGSLCFTAVMSISKFLDPSVKGVVLVFIRCLFGLIFFLPFLLKTGVDSINTKRLSLHLLRVICVCLTIACIYYGYRNLPLAVATSIGFTAPLMTTTLAIVLLKEAVTFKKWILIIVGYLGILIIIRPPEFTFNSAVYILLLANFFASAALIFAKKLTTTESTISMMFYLNVCGALISGVLACFSWENPAFQDWIVLIVMGLIGMTAQFCYVKSLQYGKPSFLAPLEYSRLVMAIPIGLFLFNEFPTFWTIFGSGIIVVVTLLITRMELSKYS